MTCLLGIHNEFNIISFRSFGKVWEMERECCVVCFYTSVMNKSWYEHKYTPFIVIYK